MRTIPTVAGTTILACFVCLQTAVALRGTSDPNIFVDIYDPGKAYNGTTLLPDHYDRQNTRVIEVDMQGTIVWEYVLPEHLRRYTNPGFDAELLPSGNILILLPKKGLCEISRSGDIVWSHWDGKVCVLHTTNATEKGIELRALMSAADSPTAWELRCEVREKLIEFIQKEYPDSLPKFRAVLEGPHAGLGE